jgi:hypothetical protein
MVILTDCDLFERLCPGQIGMLTHRFVTIWRSLYHAEILADLISAEHSHPVCLVARSCQRWNAIRRCKMLRTVGVRRARL